MSDEQKSGRLRRGFWFLATILCTVVATRVFDRSVEAMAGTAPTVWGRLQDIPVPLATRSAGLFGFEQFFYILLFMGFVSGFVYLGGELLGIKYARPEVPRPSWYGFQKVVIAVLVLLAVACIWQAQTYSTARSIYQGFHVNLEIALPKLTAPQERDLRSAFARAETRRDLEKVMKELETVLKQESK